MVRTFQGQESPDPGIPCVLISDDAGRRVHAALDQGPKKNMLRHDPIDVISLSDGGLIKATKKKVSMLFEHANHAGFEWDWIPTKVWSVVNQNRRRKTKSKWNFQTPLKVVIPT